MRTAAVIGAILLAPASFAAPQTTSEEYLDYSVLNTTPASSNVLQADILAAAAAINQQIYQSITNPTQWKKCNRNNAIYRREWAAFSTSEKKDYIKAVQCMSKLPPKTPKDKCPGCQNRYDIHNTGNFLAWHRYFTWAYEQTLRKECGYKGYQPYYNWPRWASNPAASPALDGSATSMGGNGLGGDRCTNQTFYGIPTQAQPLISIPHGAGGGCVNSGPFSDWKVNLGPVFTDVTCTPSNPEQDFTNGLMGLGRNTRCLRRDISAWTSSQWTNDQQVTKLLKSRDMKTFWYDMQGGENAFSNNFMGVHTAGHFTIGGDPGSDFVSSPGDPWFFFHHGQIDRVWWTWQNLDPKHRVNAIYGTIFLANTTAPNATLEDSMNLGYAYPGTITIRDAMSTLAGPFCYSYI
ncbi:uncharacterized protein N0V89_011363 [Didymosphaeria variabile]|uniref:Tyrosinase copper-binding domain-containing protein n=1 Tax=Didymosphaeria variabile TaxID=1932322 RepID=A0A9W8XA26_9PLEO|nr:uncharacterized protein N0V89_011363 [Didymosphaeria variabile]KAJ4345234.1 hypothetical protein N0V89_011363 [Didymosphaeria variabile]